MCCWNLSFYPSIWLLFYRKNSAIKWERLHLNWWQLHSCICIHSLSPLRLFGKGVFLPEVDPSYPTPPHAWSPDPLVLSPPSDSPLLWPHPQWLSNTLLLWSLPLDPPASSHFHITLFHITAKLLSCFYLYADWLFVCLLWRNVYSDHFANFLIGLFVF